MSHRDEEQDFRDFVTTYPIRWGSVPSLFFEHVKNIQFLWAITLLVAVSNELWEEGLRRKKGLARFLLRAIGAGSSVLLTLFVLFFRYIWTIRRVGSGWERMKFRAWQLETMGSVFAKTHWDNFAIQCHDIVEVRHHPDLTVRAHVWFSTLRDVSLLRMTQLKTEVRGLVQTGEVTARTKEIAKRFLLEENTPSSIQNRARTISG